MIHLQKMLYLLISYPLLTSEATKLTSDSFKFQLSYPLIKLIHSNKIERFLAHLAMLTYSILQKKNALICIDTEHKISPDFLQNLSML